MRINNNESSLRATTAISSANVSTSKSLEKLATALRINRASDDAAGLSVSEGLRSLIRDNQMSQRNAGDGLAMVQIADLGTQQISDSLQRMRELAMQSANGTLNDNDRKAIQTEYQQLQEQITGVAQGTTYNGKSLLAGGSDVDFQVSGDAGGASTISTQAPDLSGNLGLGSVGSAGSAQSALDGIDAAMKSVLSMRSGFGSTMNRLGSAMNNLGNALPSLTDAESQIRDTDFASETTKLMRSRILGESSTAMMVQANQLSSGIMNLLR